MLVVRLTRICLLLHPRRPRHLRRHRYKRHIHQVCADFSFHSISFRFISFFYFISFHFIFRHVLITIASIDFCFSGSIRLEQDDFIEHRLHDEVFLCRVLEVFDDGTVLVVATDSRVRSEPFVVSGFGYPIRERAILDADAAKAAHRSSLHSRGLQPMLTPGFGGCFPIAAGRFTHQTEDSVREETQQFFLSLPEEDVDWRRSVDDEPWDKFVERIRSPDTWFDHIHIQAWVNASARHVIIFELNHADPQRPRLVRIVSQHPNASDNVHDTVLVSFIFVFSSSSCPASCFKFDI